MSGNMNEPPHPVTQALDQAKAQFQATSSAVARMDKIRTELKALTSKGTAVTPEDVIHGAGKLVAGGEDPVQLASLLADMPTNGGDALVSWLAQHEQITAQNEQKLMMAHETARHQLGVASLHELARHAMTPASQGPAAQPQGQSQALDPQAQASAMAPQSPANSLSPQAS